MNEIKILYLKDTKEEKVESLLNNIAQENANLYDCIVENLRKENTFGIREDVLQYTSDHIQNFRKDQEYAFNISSLMFNVKITPEHLGWINTYFSEINKIKLDDFMIVFSEAVEKDIPLVRIEEFFSEETDELKVYEKIVSYEEEQPESKPENTESSGDDETLEVAALPEDVEITKTEGHKVEDNSPTKQQEAMTEMFDNLLTAMTYREKGDNESVLAVQDNLNKIIAKFQVAATELATYSTVIIRDWEKDKEEIRRLKVLHEIHQKLMASQQYKINEQRNEIISLKKRISIAEKSEMQRDAIKQKISDLDNLVNSCLSYEDHPLLEKH